MVNAAIANAFKVFDTDGSGTLTAAECLAILTRGASDEEREAMGMTEEDAQEIIDDFDTNGDGVLSIDEFAAAFDMFMLDEDDFAAAAATTASEPVVASGPGGGGAVETSAPADFVYRGPPAEGPGFAMFSAESHGCLGVKVLGKTFEKEMNGDRRGNSHKVAEGFGISKAVPIAFRFKVDADAKSVDADGASIVVPDDGGFLDLTLATYLPLSGARASLTLSRRLSPSLTFSRLLWPSLALAAYLPLPCVRATRARAVPTAPSGHSLHRALLKPLHCACVHGARCHCTARRPSTTSRRPSPRGPSCSRRRRTCPEPRAQRTAPNASSAHSS